MTILIILLTILILLLTILILLLNILILLLTILIILLIILLTILTCPNHSGNYLGYPGENPDPPGDSLDNQQKGLNCQWDGQDS